MAQQTDGFEQQVVEIERIRFAQPGFVLFVDHRKRVRDRIGGRARHVVGRLVVALGVADARKRRAVLHEFVVQAERLVDGLENRNLIVVVVDGERRGEPWRTCASGAPSRRSSRTQKEWKVATVGASPPSPATRDLTRSRISPAALLVKVTARIAQPGTCDGSLIRWAMRWVITRVLPLPAPARTSRGPSTCSNGLTLARVQPCKKSMELIF